MYNRDRDDNFASYMEEDIPEEENEMEYDSQPAAPQPPVKGSAASDQLSPVEKGRDNWDYLININPFTATIGYI